MMSHWTNESNLCRMMHTTQMENEKKDAPQKNPGKDGISDGSIMMRSERLFRLMFYFSKKHCKKKIKHQTLSDQ